MPELDDDFVDQLVDLCEQYDAQTQALRDRIIELMSFAEHQVAARVEVSFETQRLASELAGVRERNVELEAQLHLTEDALHAIEQSTLFRAAEPVRRIYGKVRKR